MARPKGHFFRDERTPGTWRLILSSVDGAGVRKRLCHTIHADSERDAQRQKREILHSLDTGQYVPPSKQTVRRYLETWLENKRATVERKTYQEYAKKLELYVMGTIGAYKITELAAEQIQGVYTGMADRGLSAQTIQHVHSVLRQALTYAVRSGVIVRNPALVVQLPKLAKPVRRHLTVEQANVLLDYCAGSWLHMPVLLALGLGLRRGEAVGLQWGDVDLQHGSVTIRRSATSITGGLDIKGTKTDRERSLRIPSLLIDALQAAKAARVEFLLSLGEHLKPYDWVCAWEDGSILAPDTITMTFRIAQNALNREAVARGERPVIDPPVRYQDLRRTCGTWLHQKGVALAVIQQVLGHSNITTTMRYLDITDEMQAVAADVLDAQLRKVRK